MPFEVVSEVSRGMSVSDGIHVPQEEGEVSGFCNSDFKKKITRRSNFAASRLSTIWHWHCVVDV